MLRRYDKNPFCGCQDATEVFGMRCTLRVVPCRGTLYETTAWSSSTVAKLPLPISSTKTVILTLSLLTCLLQSSLFILKQVSSYLLTFCPCCWWKKFPLNIHFSPGSLASPVSFAMTCTYWRSHWEFLWRHMSSDQLWRFRERPGAKTFLELLTLVLCMPSSCEAAWATVSPALSSLDQLGLLSVVVPSYFLSCLLCTISVWFYARLSKPQMFLKALAHSGLTWGKGWTYHSSYSAILRKTISWNILICNQKIKNTKKKNKK